MRNIILPTYIISFGANEHCIENINSEFKTRPEFNTRVIKFQSKKTELAQWEAIRSIVERAQIENDDVVLISSENHRFTKNYNYDLLIKTIYQAHKVGARLVLGGIVGGFSNVVFLPPGMFWLDRFSASQFMILFKSFYEIIIKESFTSYDSIDVILSSATSMKFLMFPMISMTKHTIDFKDQKNLEEEMLLTDHRLKKVKLKHFEFASVRNGIKS